jgi:hypothetical protein
MERNYPTSFDLSWPLSLCATTCTVFLEESDSREISISKRYNDKPFSAAQAAHSAGCRRDQSIFVATKSPTIIAVTSPLLDKGFLTFEVGLLCNTFKTGEYIKIFIPLFWRVADELGSYNL